MKVFHPCFPLGVLWGGLLDTVRRMEKQTETSSIFGLVNTCRYQESELRNLYPHPTNSLLTFMKLVIRHWNKEKTRIFTKNHHLHKYIPSQRWLE